MPVRVPPLDSPVILRGRLQAGLVLVASGSRSSSGAGGSVDVSAFSMGDVFVDVTDVSGTNPSLVVCVEGFLQAVGKWVVLVCSDRITGSGTYRVGTIWVLAFKSIRASWTISGTNPSITFSVVGEFKS